MKIEEILEIFNLISEANTSVISRSILTQFRKDQLSNNNSIIIKNAFDTRRINQETDYIPRRGLQNYHRSEPFISESMSNKITNLSKLRKVLKSLENDIGRDPEWQDSYCRTLLATLDKGLRIYQKDGDFSESQPSMASLDYINQLLYLRYRLNVNDISKIAEEDLRKTILSRDENLIYKDILKEKSFYKTNSNEVNSNEVNSYVEANFEKNISTNLTKQYHPQYEITKHDISTQSYDSLMDKLFGNIKASQENPEVERAVTITVKEKIAK